VAAELLALGIGESRRGARRQARVGGGGEGVEVGSLMISTRGDRGCQAQTRPSASRRMKTSMAIKRA